MLLCLATIYPVGSLPEGIRTVLQLIPAQGEDLFWVDGLDPYDPILLRSSDLSDVEFLGDASIFFEANIDHVAQLAVIGDFSDVSPVILARAVLAMQKGALENAALEDALNLSRTLSQLYSAMCTSPIAR